jgi:CubicO group peptidase (beta-lactamase class C family)
MTRCAVVVSLAVSVFTSSAVAAAAPESAPHPFAHVRAAIQDYVATGSLPSMSVAVAKDGKIIWEEGFGWADVRNKVPATPATLYSLASISKPITATGLMVLVNRGAVSLDKPINDYLGPAKLTAFAGNAADATVRRVANHTSGLPLHYQFFYEDESVRRPSFDDSIRRYGKLMTPPGQTYQYSNFGFGLIDDVITRAGKMPYEAFMETEVFKPLGLTNIVAGRPTRFDEKQIAKRYAPTGAVIPHYDFDHMGASAVYASAHDLARFGMFYLKNHLPDQKPIFPDSVIDEMLRPSTPPAKGPNPPRYGVGFMAYEVAGAPARGHSGGMGGVSTDLTLSLDHNIAIVVLVNAQNQRPAILAIRDMIHKTLVPGEEKLRAFAADRPFAGAWRGVVETYEKKIPVALTLKDGAALIKIGEGPQRPIADVRVDDEGVLWLSSVDGDLGHGDAGRYPYRLQFKLWPANGELTGSVTALSAGLAGRSGNGLSSWVKLTKG